ncbi:MAG: methyltransferase [Thermoplasmata archaeon]|nr:class I SAM-dependent methyltransferase family protein [Thermoplasmata archaeon]NIS10373.1 class I SAM-dependent methyltransferase family protein [Thermoplasmata archaeon]NIS18363.1 class I SAM-dependent methyltransferase family protein [Thermoplasmata archaeon]NIT75338.1 class I SAM-dependent methyltransferase family protein [Thermoplasmata archaeon]NIU47518.1 class I SAM-dependent methyltransferase family protein [Thermoplasmata archaeon]
MRGKALKVRTHDGEAAHRALARAGALDPTRRPKVEDDWLYLPLADGSGEIVGLPQIYHVVEVDLEERATKPSSLRDAPSLSPELASEVTRSMDVVGDIAVLRLKDDLRPRAAEIGRALLEVQPRLRAVAVDDGVEGELRLRSLELVAGEGPLTAVHREHGITLTVDLEQAYFSPRLATEHRRVADLVEEGERVLDMFAGVGPFAVLIGKDGRATEVHAVDLNGRAVELAIENAEANDVTEVVRVHHGDAREVVPGLGSFDRIIMNHPTAAIDYVDVATAASRSGTRIHLYLIGTPDEADEVVELFKDRMELMGRREVRTYAPGVAHYCLDLQVR